MEWKISNKYYTALVHFHRATWRDLVASLEPGIPAVLVVWEKGEVRCSQISAQHSFLIVFNRIMNTSSGVMWQSGRH